MKLSTIDLFTRARKRSEPLIAISTPDPAATVRDITKVAGDAPRISWDVVNGLRALNTPAGTNSLGFGLGASGNAKLAQASSVSPASALQTADGFTDDTILFMHNIHSFMNEPPTRQAIWNLRDKFKTKAKTLVMLGPSFAKLPQELSNDVLVLEEPLPDNPALEEIIVSQIRAIQEKHPVKNLNRAQMEKAVGAVKGLAAYPAEQAVAMSLDGTGLDTDMLWDWKRQIVEQTPGLVFDREKFTFAEIGGLERAKQFGKMLFEGNEPPALVIRLEEIEKAFSGSSGDRAGSGEGSGTTDDQVGVILTAMEDNGWNGMIAAGPPGAGKSLFSKALANTFGVPAMTQDVGAAKGKYVGESQQMIRQQLKVIKAIAGNRAFFVATSNNIENLPAALLRRFKAGIWVFELPDDSEKESIWQIQCAQWKVTGPRPDDTGYSGADIRNVCELAYKLKCSLKDAATFTISVSASKPEVIEDFRRTATGRYLSASHPGKYIRPDERVSEELVAGARQYRPN